ncbi:GAF domain-containing protein [Naasia sp. SYSU D00057]|uniref:GAF domain-containing protein n=1 Tax=Naasia sp. SYSU D00057 TaxID=2817380 RepID=UPI001B30CED3|nr:GAF domain-containing protein [Naasia sp. SYSU D00057]
MSSVPRAPLAALLAPALAPWRSRGRRTRSALPRPVDGTSAFASGPDPDRVLLLGSGPAVGFGVRSLDLALAGQLARALSGLTGRGADVDLLARTSLPVAAVGRTLADVRLWRYDAVVVTVGYEDVLRLVPLADWEELMSSLLRLLVASTASGTRVVVAGVHPVSALKGVDGPFGRLVDVHGRRMNRVTRLLCLQYARTSYVELPDPALPSPDRNGGCPEMYEEWARVLAPSVAEALPGVAPADHATSARRLRDRPDEEGARQRAVDRIRAAGLSDDPALQRITALARTLLGTSYAAITVIDRNVQWQLAQDGAGRRGEIDRALSFCARTIGSSGALIVPDALLDPRFAGFPHLEQGARFYAGFPVESPDGYRIGALCVLDDAARPADPETARVLRDLAKLVQRELARVAAVERETVPA